MELLTSDGPIIAYSSGSTTNNAIAIIRLSGFDDINQILKSFSLKNLKPRFAHFSKILSNELVLDEVIVIFYPAPNSYTGENLLEINVHGNRLNINRIVNHFIKEYDFKNALPGEFSYRALKNNKLNLSQVEGLDLLLNASSEFSLNQGFSLLSGSLQEQYLQLHDAYLKHKSAIELSIDFMDDVGEDYSNKALKDSLSELKKIISKIYSRVINNKFNLAEPEIVLYGDPNSGKSTFFNKLLDDDRSIVTDVKGTTRDFISEDINICSVFFKLVDTAGIRETQDKIEKEGVIRSRNKVERGFFKILLVNPLDYDIKNIKEYMAYNPDIIIFTHADEHQSSLEDLKDKIIGPIEPKSDGPIEPKSGGPIEPESDGPIEPDLFFLSANIRNLDLSNINDLKDIISGKYKLFTTQDPIILERHRDIILGLNSFINNYSDLLNSESDISIISSELNTIGYCISELIGIVSADDVLHNIFDNFCIGK